MSTDNNMTPAPPGFSKVVDVVAGSGERVSHPVTSQTLYAEVFPWPQRGVRGASRDRATRAAWKQKNEFIYFGMELNGSLACIDSESFAVHEPVSRPHELKCQLAAPRLRLLGARPGVVPRHRESGGCRGGDRHGRPALHRLATPGDGRGDGLGDVPGWQVRGAGPSDRAARDR